MRGRGGVQFGGRGGRCVIRRWRVGMYVDGEGRVMVWKSGIRYASSLRITAPHVRLGLLIVPPYSRMFCSLVASLFQVHVIASSGEYTPFSNLF